jgi:hypothetical protein
MDMSDARLFPGQAGELDGVAHCNAEGRLITGLPPGFDLAFGVVQGQEPVRGPAFLPEAPVKALHRGVAGLPGRLKSSSTPRS